MTGLSLLEGAAAIALILSGTMLCVRSLAASESIIGLRSSALALVVPLFGPGSFAVLEALRLHQPIRAISMGFSLASATALLALGAWSLWLGIRSIDARIFRYFVLSAPIPVMSMLALADSRISQFEAFTLLLIYAAFLASIWWLDRDVAPLASWQHGTPQTTKFMFAAFIVGGCVAALGSVALLDATRAAIWDRQQLTVSSSFAALGTIAQVAAFVWGSMRKQRSDLAAVGAIGVLAFNSTVVLAVLGLTARHRWVDPDPYAFAAIAALAVPAVLFPLAFKQTKRERSSGSDFHMDNIFAWRNLKRDLSNFQLLHHRN
ncbi:MAG TPA: hypothetical protein VMU22_05660, partial [Rhizomicrobium sp.]|nr:hypothetical protein [Rhizomicrobium sp.]